MFKKVKQQEKEWKYFLVSFERDGVKDTIVIHATSVLRFATIEKDLGRNIVIYFSQEISEEEYKEASPYINKNLRLEK